MTGPGVVTQADRSCWQQRAAAELDRILQAGGLPPIAWTVRQAGCVLAGHVNGLAPAGQVRAAFGAWRAALALEDLREQPGGGGTVFLRAAARRSGVKVRITATVFSAGHDDDTAVTS